MKIIKENPESSNFVMMEGSNTVLAAGPHSVGANKNSGVFINGPVSFTSTMESIKFSGVFRFNPVAATGLPSTIVTPIPTFIMEPPIKGVANMTAVASILMSMV